MRVINNTVLTVATVAVAALSSSVAWASAPIPADVPEPSIFGIAAAGTAAILLVVRLRQKK